MDLKVEAADPEYLSEIPLNDQLGCQTQEEFWSKLDSSSVLKCLADLQAEAETQKPSERRPLFYNLVRHAQPKFEFEKEANFYPCLKKVLREIPVPREIVFEANREGRVECYASCLNVESNEWLGARFPWNGIQLKLDFPLKTLPKSEADLRSLLTSWVLQPFWDEKAKDITAFIVINASCNACLGEKNRHIREVPDDQLWP